MDAKAPIFDSIDHAEHWPGQDGFYNREICNIRMEKDVSESKKVRIKEQSVIKYCRKCEFVCPVGRKKL